jgi:hypothetical protein
MFVWKVDVLWVCAQVDELVWLEMGAWVTKKKWEKG